MTTPLSSLSRLLFATLLLTAVSACGGRDVDASEKIARAEAAAQRAEQAADRAEAAAAKAQSPIMADGGDSVGPEPDPANDQDHQDQDPPQDDGDNPGNNG
jgi:hypothetical protein